MRFILRLMLLLPCGCVTSLNAPPLQDAAARAVQEDPKSPERWVEYGRAALFCGNTAAAEGAFRRALELDAEFVPAYKHLGLVLTDSQRYPEAETVYQQALKVNGRDSELWTSYAYCLVAMGKEHEAVESFHRSVEFNTDLGAVISARLGCAGVLSRWGDEIGAKAEYEQALELNPDVVRALAENK